MPDFVKYFLLLFISLLLSISEITFGQPQGNYLDYPIFRKLTNDDGLSQGTINTIAQDEQGFIWIGTNDGLNRYDGYEIRVFRNNMADTTTISSNEITKITFDANGIMWIGTQKGLNRFNPTTGKFNLVQNPLLGASCSISDLAIDQDNILWIGTKNQGLFSLDIYSGRINVFKNDPANDQSIPSNNLLSLFVDSHNTLWSAFYSGDICFRKSHSAFKTINPDQPKDEKIQNLVSSIQEDRNRNLWISTYGRSLLYLNTQNLQLELVNDSRDKGMHITHTISSLALQNDSLLWMGTDGVGLQLLNTRTNKLRIYPVGDNGTLYQSMKSLFLDKDENLWIGTNGKGLNILSPYTEMFFTITPSTKDDYSLRFSSVRSILQDNDSIVWAGGYYGLQKINLHSKQTEAFYNIIPYTLCNDQADNNILWIGTEGSGVFFLNKQSGNLTELPSWQEMNQVEKSEDVPGGRFIYKITNLDDKTLMVGANTGLYLLNKKNLSFHFLQIDSNIRSDSYGGVNDIYTDSQSQIWISSNDGRLYRFIPETKSFTTINLSFEGNIQPFTRINCIFEDHQKRMWLGTNYGIVQLDDQGKITRFLTEQNGLPNNMVYGILEDEAHNFWMSTNRGLSQFNPETEEFKSFDKNNGLPANEFNRAAFFQYSPDQMLFGSVEGLVFFNPQNIHSALAPEKVAVTDATIIGTPNRTNFAVSYTNNITLQPRQNLLHLKFSPLKYYGNIKSNFKFRLTDTGDEWVELGKNRNLTLSFNQPGIHKLEVVADNGNGIFGSEPTSISIHLLPRYYQTLWFRALLVILIASLIFGIYITRINIIKAQRNKLEKLVEHRTDELKTANKDLELANATKDKFFSIIAHDLKSPFNSMIGFSNILVDDWGELKDNDKREMVGLIKETTEDTYQLLVNLLEWSRIQINQVIFDPSRINLRENVEKITSQVKADALLKNIHIINEIPPELMIYADQNMLQTIIRNLLTNAIKFTPKNGMVTIEARDDQHQVECCVKDTGIGMSKKVTDNLFQIQFHNSCKGTEGETGTGLGLVLCREFITKHQGSMSVLSEPGKGSTFCFTLPHPKEI